MRPAGEMIRNATLSVLLAASSFNSSCFAQGNVDLAEAPLPTDDRKNVAAEPTLEAAVANDENGSGPDGSRFVLLIVGLPGDEARRDRFDAIATAWNDWLTHKIGVGADHITTLGHSGDREGPPANQTNIRHSAAKFCQQLGKRDSLWVFLLGHGSQDQRHGWFHLPGPDLHDSDWAGLFADLKAGEQVFWLTHSASGRFIKAFSLPGRVVIAATDDEEVNETRFPQALADVMKAQIVSDDASSGQPENADRAPQVNHPTPTTLLELFRDTADQVRRYYDEQGLVPTEHPRLDDNGDGNASESDQLADVATLSADGNAAAATIDGFLAGRIRLNEKLPPHDIDNAGSEANSE
ncbi:hypothetical protein [Stieleria mannarensis]|uniref:hypothetical protein n=1 Tax=Stieleria mannarensis TaxID=2755585 RepID=UPI0016025274|nr:hypothetical protein [Rhodopirellula sp. JC639]